MKTPQEIAAELVRGFRITPKGAGGQNAGTCPEHGDYERACFPCSLGVALQSYGDARAAAAREEGRRDGIAQAARVADEYAWVDGLAASIRALYRHEEEE